MQIALKIAAESDMSRRKVKDGVGRPDNLKQSQSLLRSPPWSLSSHLRKKETLLKIHCVIKISTRKSRMGNNFCFGVTSTNCTLATSFGVLFLW